MRHLVPCFVNDGRWPEEVVRRHFYGRHRAYIAIPQAKARLQDRGSHAFVDIGQHLRCFLAQRLQQFLHAFFAEDIAGTKQGGDVWRCA
jgi:hypothetical protein